MGHLTLKDGDIAALYNPLEHYKYTLFKDVSKDEIIKKIDESSKSKELVSSYQDELLSKYGITKKDALNKNTR